MIPHQFSFPDHWFSGENVSDGATGPLYGFWGCKKDMFAPPCFSMGVQLHPLHPLFHRHCLAFSTKSVRRKTTHVTARNKIRDEKSQKCATSKHHQNEVKFYTETCEQTTFEGNIDMTRNMAL